MRVTIVLNKALQAAKKRRAELTLDVLVGVCTTKKDQE